MSPQELVAELNRMGIAEQDLVMLAVLPLIEVAWADGSVHAKEHTVIVRHAEERLGLDGDSMRLLEDWLEFRPTNAYLERGRTALIEAARRERIPLEGWTLDEAMTRARDVATAAGGLLGFGTIDAAEASTLEDLAAAFERVTGTHWDFDDLLGLDDGDEEPTSEVWRVSGPVKVASGVETDGARGAELILIDDSEQPAWSIAEELTIGRSRKNHVWIQTDSRISRFHCRIVQEEGRWYLEDRSANGTRVLGERASWRRLFGGEDIEVGATRFRFQLL